MGGAEQSLCVMANTWAEEGIEVEIIRLETTSDAPYYELDKRILLRDLQCVSGEGGALQQLKQLSAALRGIRREVKRSEPDIIVSFLDWVNIVSIFAIRGLDIPIVFSERVDPRYAPTKRFWKFLRPLAYRLGDALVVLSAGCLEAFPESIRQKAAVIPNPIPETTEVFNIEKRQRIIGMGRLVPQKGFDLLIEAFVHVAAKFPEWQLVIYGEGEQRAKLEGMIEKEALQGRVQLPGVTREPRRELSESSIFVLSSRFEGFGRVLAEAMACGLAVISFDCPSGPSEILRSGKDGVLIENISSQDLAQELERLMEDSARREELGSRARERSQAFHPRRVAKEWLQLIELLLNDRQAPQG